MSDATRIISKAADLIDIATVDLPVVNTPLVTKLAFGLDRANHTGTQAIATVTGLQTRLDALPVLAVENLIGTTSGGITTSLVNDGDHVVLDVGGIVLDSSTGGIDCGVIKSAQYDFTSTTIFNYTTDTAAAHRTAMGLGTTDPVQFAAISGTTGTFSGAVLAASYGPVTGYYTTLVGGGGVRHGIHFASGTSGALGGVSGVKGLCLASDGALGWSNTVSGPTSGSTTRLYRLEAGTVGIGVDNSNQFAGNLKCTNGEFVGNLTASGTVTGKSFVEGVYDAGTPAGAGVTLDLANGSVQKITLTAATSETVTLPAVVAGATLLVEVLQAAGGTGTVTFQHADASAVIWQGGVVPVMTPTASYVDVFSFVANHAGTKWRGTAAQNFAS